MAENLYIEKYKYSNPKYREGWDRIFKIRNLAYKYIETVKEIQRKDLERNLYN